MPTHEDNPWLRDQRAVTTPLDPSDPEHSARLHEAVQVSAIDDARKATSQPPPAGPPVAGDQGD